MFKLLSGSGQWWRIIANSFLIYLVVSAAHHCEEQADNHHKLRNHIYAGPSLHCNSHVYSPENVQIVRDLSSIQN